MNNISRGTGLQIVIGLPVFLIAASVANAVVIRHDVSDSAYIVCDCEFPALVDLPQEGHGILISDQWVLTVAHNVNWRPVTEVTVNGQIRSVEKVIAHSGYRSLPHVPEAGDAAPFMDILKLSDDIALMKLSEPVRDVAPVDLYRAPDEQGKLVKIYGKGATGNGVDGQAADSPHRDTLRRAYNHISSAEGKWLTYRFDPGAQGHRLEGSTGSGDSGGPLLVLADGEWVLAGISAWQFVPGDISDFRPGHYGQVNYQVRISHYVEWIDSIMAAH